MQEIVFGGAPGVRSAGVPAQFNYLSKEPLINSSFRAERSVDPESSCFYSSCYWIIHCAHPVGRPSGVQRATRFCPAYAGMTIKELIRPFLIERQSCGKGLLFKSCKEYNTKTVLM